MAVTADGMKAYGYATDATWQESVAKLCLEAAQSYLKKAGLPETLGDDPLYELACYMLATDWYDNREVQVIGTVKSSLMHGLNSIILQLREWSTA